MHATKMQVIFNHFGNLSCGNALLVLVGVYWN